MFWKIPFFWLIGVALLAFNALAEEAKQTFTPQGDLLTLQALLAAERGNPDESLDFLDQLPPQYPRGEFYEFSASLMQGQEINPHSEEEAIEALQIALWQRKLDWAGRMYHRPPPQRVELKLLLGHYALLAGETEKAEAWLRAWQDAPHSQQTLFLQQLYWAARLRGDASLAQKRWDLYAQEELYPFPDPEFATSAFALERALMRYPQNEYLEESLFNQYLNAGNRQGVDRLLGENDHCWTQPRLGLLQEAGGWERLWKQAQQGDLQAREFSRWAEHLARSGQGEELAKWAKLYQERFPQWGEPQLWLIVANEINKSKESGN